MTTLVAPALPQPPSLPRQRRRPIGAEVLDPQTTHFRVWAPQSRRVELVIEHPSRNLPLDPEGHGYHSTRVEAGGLLQLARSAWSEIETGRRAIAKHVRDGLIPNYFPDGKVEGVYHTADATRRSRIPRGCVAQAWSVAEVLRCWAKTAS